MPQVYIPCGQEFGKLYPNLLASGSSGRAHQGTPKVLHGQEEVETVKDWDHLGCVSEVALEMEIGSE